MWRRRGGLEPIGGALLGVALLVSPRTAVAQRVAVAQYSERDGLQQSQVTGLAVDRDGFLWIGTRNGGLSRFDGASFRLMTREDGFSDRIVGPVVAAPDGALWVGGESLSVRLPKAKATGETFARVISSTVSSLALHLDSPAAPRGPLGSTVFAGGPGGLYRARVIAADLGKRESIAFSRLDARPVTALSSAGGLLFVGRTDGLEVLDLSSGSILQRRAGISATALLAGADGTVLAATTNGLEVVDSAGRRTPALLGQAAVTGTIHALARDDRERVWLGAERGAFRLSPRLDAIELGPRDGLAGIRIGSLAAAAGGAVWLGSDGAGLFRYAPSRFAVVGQEAGLPELIAMSMGEAPDGTLWIATARGELAQLVNGTFRRFGEADGLPRVDRFRDLAVASDGRVDATWQKGMVRRAPGSSRFMSLLHPDGATSTGLAFGGRSGAEETWLGTSLGLRVVRGDRIVKPSEPVGRSVEGAPFAPLFAMPITALCRDGENGLLVAVGSGGKGLAGGLFALDLRSLSARRLGPDAASLATRISGAEIWTLARARDGAVWAASIRGVLRIGRDGSVRLVDSKAGLPDDSVDAINAAPDGSVWLSTDRGLAHLAAEGTVQRVYGFTDGLPSREGIVRSSCRDRLGRLWFGLVGALVRYDPTGDESESPPPRLYIERLALPNRHSGEEDTRIALSVVEFGDARGVRTIHRLSPLQTRFSAASSERAVTWAGLAPGNYRFVAHAVDRVGRRGPEAAVDFRIEPLWHETRTARVALALLVLAIGAFLPAGLRAGAAVASRAQAHVVYFFRELFAPKYRPIEDDPYVKSSLELPAARERMLAEILETLDKAWNRVGIVVLLGPPGIGKGALVDELAKRAGSNRVIFHVPPVPSSTTESGVGSGWHEALFDRLVDLPFLKEDLPGLRLGEIRQRLTQTVQKHDSGAGSPSRIGSRLDGLSDRLKALSSILQQKELDLLLVDDDPGTVEPLAARRRATLASALLRSAHRISLLVARDVEPSLFAAEEPELSRIARLVRLPALNPEEGGAWLTRVAGERLRFAPGVAALAAREVGGEPARIRTLGSTLIRELSERRRNRVGASEVKRVLTRWEQAPPPMLGALWVRLSAGERAVAAGLGAMDAGRAETWPMGRLFETLAGHGFALSPVEIGAFVDRLVEAEVLVRHEDRIAFRDPLVARFVARHRPVSQEQGAAAGVVGPYELLEEIGTGGMGTVYRARRLDDRAERAVKVIHPHLLNTHDMRRRFVREGEIGIAISHPGIVRIYERGEAAGRAFIAMEYLPGRTLREIVKRSGPAPIPVAVRIATDLADAVAALHEAGVVHRDLKSENVMVSPEGGVKILDFGLARLAEGTRLTATGHVAGTPEYMAPEQIHGDAVGNAVDIWALAICLYEMLVGVSPFARGGTVATFEAALREEPVPAGKVRTGIPPELDATVLKALAKDAANRWSSMREMHQALARLLPKLPSASTVHWIAQTAVNMAPTSETAPTAVTNERARSGAGSGVA